MGTIVLIISYILIVCEFVWYFTCTKHEDIPLIAVLFWFIINCIPGLNVFTGFIANPVIIGFFTIEEGIELKDNWFNRKFLAHHDE